MDNGIVPHITACSSFLYPYHHFNPYYKRAQTESDLIHIIPSLKATHDDHGFIVSFQVYLGGFIVGYACLQYDRSVTLVYWLDFPVILLKLMAALEF